MGSGLSARSKSTSKSEGSGSGAPEPHVIQVAAKKQESAEDDPRSTEDDRERKTEEAAKDEEKGLVPTAEEHLAGADPRCTEDGLKHKEEPSKEDAPAAADPGSAGDGLGDGLGPAEADPGSAGDGLGPAAADPGSTAAADPRCTGDGFERKIEPSIGDAVAAHSTGDGLAHKTEPSKKDSLEEAIEKAGKDRKGGLVFRANEQLAATEKAPWGFTSLVLFQREKTAMKVGLLEGGRAGKISTSTQTTDAAIRYLASQHRGTRLAALSFANNVFVGGKYFQHDKLVGAQEEDLCYKFPALFTSLQWVEKPGRKRGEYFLAHTEHISENPGKERARSRMRYPKELRFGSGVSALPGRCPFHQEKTIHEEKNVLFTTELDLMRSSTYTLLPDEERVKAGIVTAAAPVWRKQAWYSDDRYISWLEEKAGSAENSWNKDWYKDALLNIFFAPKFVDQQYDVLVVGAWGLGAFLTDVPPDTQTKVKKTVAEAYVEVIKEYNLLDFYKEIHFAWGPSTFQVMQKVLESTFKAADYTDDIQKTIIERDHSR